MAGLIERYEPDEPAGHPVAAEERLRLYRHLLGTGAVFVAEDPEPVGFSAAIIRDGVWFLSQLWVLPERQEGGIGGALLDEALVWGRGSGAFSVVASPHPGAQLLYLRASMYPMWALYELTGTGVSVPSPPEGMSELTDEDRPWVDDLDREVRGAARPEDHAFLSAEATGMALRRSGEPRGYVYAGPSGRIGPAAARHPSEVPLLIRAGRHLAGAELTVSVPGPNWAALRELVAAGLATKRSNAFLASRPLGDGSRYLSGGGALG